MKKLLIFCFWMVLLGQFAQVSPYREQTDNYTYTVAETEEDVSGKIEKEKNKTEDKNIHLLSLHFYTTKNQSYLIYPSQFYKDITLTPIALPPNT